MSYKVELINKDLGRSCLFGRVQGLSGKTYATSRYQPCGYHVAELTADEYEKSVEDISRAWQRPMCRWIPRFVELAAAGKIAADEDSGASAAPGGSAAMAPARNRKTKRTQE